MQTHPCPKCNRLLCQAGSVRLGDAEFPVFTCDECLVRSTLFGVPMELDLTFAVDGDGNVFDPASEDSEAGGK